MENFAKLLIFLSTPFLRINSLHILANLALSLTLFTIGGGAYDPPPDNLPNNSNRHVPGIFWLGSYMAQW